MITASAYIPPLQFLGKEKSLRNPHKRILAEAGRFGGKLFPAGALIMQVETRNFGFTISRSADNYFGKLIIAKE